MPETLKGKPEEIRQRAKELEAKRKEAYRTLEQNPNLTPTQLSVMLGVPKSTAGSWITRKKKWAKKVEAETEKPAETPILPTPAQIADSLLERVVEVLKDYDYLTSEVKELRAYRDRCTELERALAKETEEKERILKLHNEQIKRGEFTTSEELVQLSRFMSQAPKKD